MKRILIAVLLLFIVSNNSLVFGLSYLAYEQWGDHSWHDAEKERFSVWPFSWGNGDDDNMCWAAAASNLIDWHDWNSQTSIETEQDIFYYFQDHWSDDVGVIDIGLSWWFDGDAIVDTLYKEKGFDPNSSDFICATIDKKGGGNFNFESEHVVNQHQDNKRDIMGTITHALSNGFGVAIGMGRDDLQIGHAITVWGYEYDENHDTMTGLYVTDSDDYVNQLVMLDVAYDENQDRWNINYNDSNWIPNVVDTLNHIPNVDISRPVFYAKNDTINSTNEWFINEVITTKTIPTPEPSTFVLLSIILLILYCYHLYQKNPNSFKSINI